MYKKTYYEICISPHMPNLTITWCKAYYNLVLNSTGLLKLLHLYGNLAMVVTTSNKLHVVADPRQACMYPC